MQYNLFAYCFNNPVNMSDETGAWPSWLKKVAAAVAVVAVVAAVAAITVATAGAGTAAAVIAVGAVKGAAIGMATGAAMGAATGAVSHRMSTGSWSGAGTAALNGMGDGALSGAVTGAITGAAGSAVKVAQAAKSWDSGTFKSGYQSMKYHYNKHVVSEGLTKGNSRVPKGNNTGRKKFNKNDDDIMKEFWDNARYTWRIQRMWRWPWEEEFERNTPTGDLTFWEIINPFRRR